MHVDKPGHAGDISDDSLEPFIALLVRRRKVSAQFLAAVTKVHTVLALKVVALVGVSSYLWGSKPSIFLTALVPARFLAAGLCIGFVRAAHISEVGRGSTVAEGCDAA